MDSDEIVDVILKWLKVSPTSQFVNINDVQFGSRKVGHCPKNWFNFGKTTASCITVILSGPTAKKSRLSGNLGVTTGRFCRRLRHRSIEYCRPLKSSHGTGTRSCSKFASCWTFRGPSWEPLSVLCAHSSAGIWGNLMGSCRPSHQISISSLHASTHYCRIWLAVLCVLYVGYSRVNWRGI
jgi:hypothetical protein